MKYLPQITSVLVDQLGIAAETVKPESRIIEDLGCDSLDTVEILMAFEEELDIEIPEAEMEACKTVADIDAMLCKKLS